MPSPQSMGGTSFNPHTFTIKLSQLWCTYLSLHLMERVMAFLYLLPLLLCLLVLRLSFNFFTPGLRSIPGPFFARFSNLWRLISTASGRHELTLQKLHNRHGSVVRIGPNVLSISDPEVIESIYGYKSDFIKVINFSTISSLHSPVVLTKAATRAISPRSCRPFGTAKFFLPLELL